MNQPKTLPGFKALAMQFQSLNLQTLLWRKNAKANAADLAPISLRITLNGQRIERSTGIRIAATDWDGKNERLRGSSALVKKQNEQLLLLKAHVSELVNLMKASGIPVTIRSLRAQLDAPDMGKSPCFIALCQHQLTQHYGGNQATLQMRQYHLDALVRWHGRTVGDKTQPLPLNEFTPDLAADFYNWLLYTQELAISTANNTVGTLSTLFGFAVEMGLADAAENPFRVLRKKKKTPVVRLRLSDEQLGLLREADLSGSPALARDVYLAQYYLHGSRVGAVLKLRWVDVQQGRVRLQAEKGGPLKSIPISSELARILARYEPAQPSPYAPIFPLLPANFSVCTAAAQFRHRKAAVTKLNKALRIVATLVGLPDGLHTHTARHTLAMHAALKGGMRIAQKMLGHTSLTQTEAYVGELPDEVIRAAEAALYGAMTVAPTPAPTPPAEGGRVLPLWGEERAA